MRRRAALHVAFLPLVGPGEARFTFNPERGRNFPSPPSRGGTAETLTPAPAPAGEGVPNVERRTLRFPDVGAEVAVEVADTPEARALGLGGHAPLEDGQGMLFVFGARGRFPFWMRGMTFPLDMLWLDAPSDTDESLVVVHVARDVAPDPPGTPDASRATWGVDVGASALWL